jgi:PRTRC genetic system protein E
MAKTNFFQGLESLQIKGTIKMALRLSSDNVWTGSFLIVGDDLQDKAVQKIVPLNFSGTSLELGEAFFDALKTPLQKTQALFSNIADFEKSVAEAEKASKMKLDTTKTGTQPKTRQSAKYSERMKKAAELESKGKYGEAIGALPKPTEFPDMAKEIEAKLQFLKEKRGGLSLFDSEQKEEASDPEAEENTPEDPLAGNDPEEEE